MRAGNGAAHSSGRGRDGEQGPGWTEGQTPGTEKQIRGRTKIQTWAGVPRDKHKEGHLRGDLTGIEVLS